MAHAPSTGVFRVLQIPADHPYVDRCAPASSAVLATTPNAGQQAPWAPSPAFETAWLAEHVHEFDAVHLHFGFDHLTPEGLGRWVLELRRHDLPLVFTVHDLRNPHHDTAGQHDAQLDILLAAAAQVLTLTDAAADVLYRRWGRQAIVVPHPHVADLDTLPVHRAPQRLAGIHLKDLRRNVVEPSRLVAAAARGASAADGRLRVDVHPGVLDRPELAGVRELAAAGAIELHPHQRFSDDELIGYLAGIDVSVLPYRFGTHSGWLEACRDVGTRVVAPTCGFYRDQWAEVVSYQHDERAGLNERSLADAVHDALRRPAAPAAGIDARRSQLAEVQELHARLYAGLARTRRNAA